VVGCGEEFGVAVEAESWDPLSDDDGELTQILGGSPTGDVWGAGITIDTGNPYNSDASVKLSGTINAGIIWRDQIPVGDGAAWRVWAALKDDGSSGSDGAYIGLVEYDSDGNYSQEQHLALDDAADLTATFQVFQEIFTLDADTAFVRPYVVRSGTQSINVWVGLLDAEPVEVGFSAGVGSSVTYASGSTKVAIDTEDFDHGGVFDAASNYRFTAPKSGRCPMSDSMAIGAV